MILGNVHAWKNKDVLSVLPTISVIFMHSVLLVSLNIAGYCINGEIYAIINMVWLLQIVGDPSQFEYFKCLVASIARMSNVKNACLFHQCTRRRKNPVLRLLYHFRWIPGLTKNSKYIPLWINLPIISWKELIMILRRLATLQNDFKCW